MRFCLCLFFSLLLSTTILAQIDQRIARNATPLNKVERMNMPSQNNEALYEAELEQRKPSRPDHFAVPMDTHITPEKHGTWEQLEGGKLLWRMRVYSKNAKSLNLGFTKYVMPASGSMILYSPDYDNVMGPFTPADNETHEQLWTPILDGEEIVIEIQINEAEKAQLQLELSKVNHDFVGINAMMSGSCNLDVACGEADGWGIVDGYRDIIRSVAYTTLNGFANCTGFLVNNTRNDRTPYFMTAFHCGVNAGNAPTLVTYWNFENSICRQPDSAASGQAGDGNYNTFNTGSTLRANWQPSDVTLVELDDPVVEEAVAYFSGWDATVNLPTNAIGIHHPNNDEKRISFEDDPLYIGDWASGGDPVPSGDHLIVGDWDIGTTEGGSSGSPVFNQDKLVVGQLHGGGAGCGNDLYDSYGWFHVSWEGGGTPSTRLKDWLDPDNTGILTIGGQDALYAITLSSSSLNICGANQNMVNVSVSANENFEDDVTLSIIDAPAELILDFDNSTIAAGTSTMLNIANLDGIPSGNYAIKISATDGENTSQTSLFLQIYANVATAVTLVDPANNEDEVNVYPTYEWAADADAETYTIQIASDANFLNIIDEAGDLSINEYNGIILDAITTYYWRVRSHNTCGIGPWSISNAFTTTNVVCQIDESIDVPVAIDNGGPDVYVSSLAFPLDGEILDVNVNKIVGVHTWVSDLEVSLTSPSGTVVRLWAGECGQEDDFNIGFDDQATESVLPCPITDGNLYQPIDALSAFNGENAIGTWTLTIEDTYSDDGGSLDDWELQICTAPSSSANVVTSVSSATVCDGVPFDFNILIGSGFQSTVTLETTISPNVAVDISYDKDITNLSAGDVVEASITDWSGIAMGDYTLHFTASDGVDMDDTELVLFLESAPEAVNLGLPNDNEMNVDRMPFFTWLSAATGSGYIIQIATDVNFNNIIETATFDLMTTAYNLPTALDGLTTYYWRILTSSECGEVSSEVYNFTTMNALSVDILPENLLKIMPNPTTGLVNIHLTKALADFEIALYSINGQILKQESFDRSTSLIKLNLSDYNKGMYFIKLTSSKGILTKKIIVQ